MPRRRTTTSVSRDFNHDPILRSLRREVADWWGYSWLELAFMADEGKGEITITVDSLVDKLAAASGRTLNSRVRKQVLQGLEFLTLKDQLESKLGPSWVQVGSKLVTINASKLLKYNDSPSQKGKEKGEERDTKRERIGTEKPNPAKSLPFPSFTADSAPRPESPSPPTPPSSSLGTPNSPLLKVPPSSQGKPVVGIPENLPLGVTPDDWRDFAEIRRRIRAPLTARAAEMIVRKLHRLEAEGSNPRDCLLQSIERAWRGVFHVNDGTRASSSTDRWKEQVRDTLFSGLPQ